MIAAMAAELTVWLASKPCNRTSFRRQPWNGILKGADG